LTNSGFIVYSGLIGGILCGWVIMCIKKQSFLVYFDLAAPSIAVAQGFGRIGCYLAGCCYGRPTTSPFGAVFRNSDFVPPSLRLTPLIPTQLISSAGNFAMMAILLLYARRKPKSGRVGGLYIVLYAVGRFFIEFWRGDAQRGALGALSTSQVVALVMLLPGIYLLIAPSLPKKEGEKEDKSSLRKKYLALRDELTATEREEKSQAIIEKLQALDSYKEAEIILTYIDHGSEVQTSALAEKILSNKEKRLFCPKVKGKELTFYEITDLKQLKPGYKGIKEPPDTTPPFDAALLDQHTCLLLVPGLAFSKKRERLGSGGGHYDRFLEAYPALPTAALAYTCQLTKTLPTEEGDVKVDTILTEKEK
jgi:5,10-methenyltetrahydrofolate synthetase